MSTNVTNPAQEPAKKGGLRQFIKKSPFAYKVALAAYLSYRKASEPLRRLSQSEPDVFDYDSDKKARFKRLLRDYLRRTALGSDPVRIIQLTNMLEAANRLEKGDYIELGTFRGATLKVIHRLMDPQQTLYSLDTFEGFDERDITIEQGKYRNQWKKGNFAPTSPEGVARYVGDGQWPANLKVIPGWFPESFSGLEEKRWRFVHIDFDLYQPIKAALETLWANIVPGGIVLVHDYGCHGFPAARQAVDEFCASVGIAAIELADHRGTAALRKPLK